MRLLLHSMKINKHIGNDILITLNAFGNTDAPIILLWLAHSYNVFARIRISKSCC